MENVPTREATEQRTTRPLPPLTPEREREERTSAEVVTGGSMAQAIGGIAVVALAIISLAGVFPNFLAPIAVIVMGVALLLEGVALASRFTRLFGEVAPTAVTEAELGSGTSAEFLGGVAGIVLGILSLVGVYPAVLVPIAVMTFGAALLLSVGSTLRLNRLASEHWTAGHEHARIVAATMVSSAGGAQGLVGLSAIVLGIIALVGMHPMTLALVGLLCLGTGVLFLGAAVCGKMSSIIHG